MFSQQVSTVSRSRSARDPNRPSQIGTGARCQQHCDIQPSLHVLQEPDTNAGARPGPTQLESPVPGTALRGRILLRRRTRETHGVVAHAWNIHQVNVGQASWRTTNAATPGHRRQMRR